MAGTAETFAQLEPFGLVSVGKEVCEDECPLGFVEVARKLFAVTRSFVGRRYEIQHVVADLEGGAEQASGLLELRVGFGVRAQGAQPQRGDGRVAGRLAPDHLQIVVLADVETPRGDPAEVQMLPFGGALDHPGELVDDRLAAPMCPGEAVQVRPHDDVQRVADVECDRHPHQPV